MNIQDWFPLGWTGWVSLQSKGLSRVFSNTEVQKCRFFGRLAYRNLKVPGCSRGPVGLGGLVPCVLHIELSHKTLLSFLRLPPPP